MTEGTAFRVDPHVKVLDEAVVERAKARGLDALVYAPHFTRLPEIERRAERFGDDELAVIPGRELFTGHWNTRRHVLAVDLEAPVPDFVTLRGAMDELARQDATVLVPHPGFMTVSMNSEEVGEFADVVDAVEVYNPKHWAYHNRRARRIAAENNKPGFASSYAHLTGSVGEAWTAFEQPVTTGAELGAALAAGDGEVGHRTGASHRLRRSLEFAHLGWENSWEKVDRVLLQGTEPTHPGHVAYDGRFDDVRVY